MTIDRSGLLTQKRVPTQMSTRRWRARTERLGADLARPSTSEKRCAACSGKAARAQACRRLTITGNYPEGDRL